MSDEIDGIIDRAIKEDIPEGDITSESIIPQTSHSRAVFLTKDKGILAGIDVAARVFERIDHSVSFERSKNDGNPISAGDVLAEIAGKSISLLKGERTALNFVQRMSGIATATNGFVKILEGSRTKVLDTRKTTPGLRILEKYAVRVGGGENHRMNLSDMVLIKDNHLKLVGSISEAVEKARQKISPGTKIEVEATGFKQVKEAVESGADMVMLDNMSAVEIMECVDWVRGRVLLEVSGKVDRTSAEKYSAYGVDFISIGSLTHSYRSLDISMEMVD
jgi:nicotinate-nucleotide pyrophosphorylase (carboxylating)